MTGMGERGTPSSLQNGSMPTIDQILDKHLRAMGGRENIKQLSSRVMKGSFQIRTAKGSSGAPPQMITGTVEFYQKAPNKSLAVINFPNYIQSIRGFDGSRGWSNEPPNGLRDVVGLELGQMKVNSEFYFETKLNELYPVMKLKGRERVGVQEAYVVDAKAAGEAEPESFYFNTRTGLVIRRRYIEASPQGKAPAQSYYANYKAVNGVQIPFSMTYKGASLEMRIKITTVKHNVKIADQKFEKPPAK